MFYGYNCLRIKKIVFNPFSAMSETPEVPEIHILLGLTGSVASIKASKLVNDLKRSDIHFKGQLCRVKVKIVATEKAKHFNEATRLTLTLIRINEKLLTDKTKPWYRNLPKDVPSRFMEHAFGRKIFDL